MALTKRRQGPQPRGRRPASRSLPAQNGGGRLLLHCAGLVLTIMIVAAAACGVLYVRLSHGPVSLKYIAAAIEKGITAELPGLQARMDDALLAVTDGGMVELRLTNLRIFEPDGDVVATVPMAAVELSRPALWSFKMVPSRIDLIDAKLSLIYTKEAGLVMSFGREGMDQRLNPERLNPERLGPGSASAPTAVPAIVPADGGKLRGVNLAAMITEATTQARKKLDVSSYLNQIGVRDAVVSLDNMGVRSQWRVLEGVVEIDHLKQHSVVSGSATIASERGPWSLTIRSEETDNAQSQVLAATINNLVPRTLGTAIPQLSLLETLDAPVAAEATLDVAAGGTVTSGKLAINVGRGQFVLPDVGDVPFSIESGQIGLTYDGSKRRFELGPSNLMWGTSRVGLTGSAVGEMAGDKPWWTVNLATTGGQLMAEEFGVPVVAIEQGVLKGRVAPLAGEMVIDQLAFKAGGMTFSSQGQFFTGSATGTGGAKFDASIGPTPADTLKAMWPRAFASKARTWVGERIKRGTVKSGALHFVSGRFAKDGGVVGADGSLRRVTLAMEATDIAAQPLGWMSPMEAPRALIRLENNTIEVTVPDAFVVLGPNRRVPVKAGRFISTDLEIPISNAEVSFKTLAPLVPVLEILDQSPLRLLRANGVTTDGIDGKVDGQVKLTFPLIADLDAKSIKIEAKARVFDGKAKQLAGTYDVQGATINVDVSDAAVGVTGDLLANGVPVKLGWHRILEDNGEKQPPLRLSANLDNADRVQLGIDINHILQGEVPVEILIEKGAVDETSVRLRADLTNSDITLESIGWRKPPGRAVSLGADIVKGKVHKFELQNLRIAGDDIAIEGSVAIGADNKVREVLLPSFSLNVVTRLDVQALLKEGGGDKSGVWQVKVKGQNFDGRDLFRSLFSVGPGADKAGKLGKPGAGMDLEAEIDNVIGNGEVSLRGLRLKMSRRGEKLSFLEARGTLGGGGPVAISMVPEAGQPRRLLADTTDAGQAFKLIGFYPNMQLGRARMEVNIDGRGPAEKTGTVWVEDFRILGDPVVSEVLGSAPDPTEAGKPVRRSKSVAQREVIQFDRMKIPFSVGYGQFVIDNAYLRGPVLGVSLVGKADFKLQSLNLGGTYIPLQGLNNVLGDVPILGALVSGTKGDGVFGITFAVQGPMAQPQVLVNPLSLLAPSFTREFFQMTNQNPKVIPRDEKGPAAPVEKRVRSSSSPGEAAQGKGGGETPASGGGVGADGWVSETAPVKGKK